MFKKIKSLFFKPKVKSDLPQLTSESIKRNIFGFKKKNPSIIEIMADLINSKIDYESLEALLDEEDKENFKNDKKAFNKAVKTAGLHKGNRSAKNKTKILKFISILIDKNYSIKIKK